MKYIYNDGGRKAAGYKGSADDCIARAIAIIADMPYQQVYDELNLYSKGERISKSRPTRGSARTGIWKDTMRKYMESIGFKWVATMHIGKGCTVHLTKDELPAGRLVVQVSKHVTAVIDGVIYDTHNPARGGKRCVYGYFYIE